MDRFGNYAEFYDLEYNDRDEDLLMIEQFAARSDSPILEIGCGTGRVLLPLAHRGFQLTGVDASLAMLDRARARLAADGIGDLVTLVHQDIRRLELGQRFNMAFAAANTFMDLLTTADQQETLARICRHLNPGGLLLLDLIHPDLGRLSEGSGQLIHDWTKPHPDSGLPMTKFYSQVTDSARQLIHFTFFVDVLDGDGLVRRTVFPFSLRYLSPAELELLLRHAGLEVEALYGSYDLHEFDADSEKLIAVARRPG
jgi:SAM-dependent methyltransferase